MSVERQRWQGQKQEQELAGKKLRISIDGLRNNIRLLLNPHDPVEEIDPETIRQQAFELADKVVLYRDIKEKIKNLNRALGIE